MSHHFSALKEAELGLFIDLYELTMASAYHAEGMDKRAVFTLHFRKLPPQRNFMLACGQHYAALLATSLRFPPEQVARLRTLGRFDESFLQWLANFRFSGDIRVLPEGTPVFPHEPILEVDAPLAEGQLLETLLMNYVHTESVLATKALRMVNAAKGRPVIDFGMRRMHGFDAALRGVRAYRAAGIDATSNVLGSFQYGLPASGTMAHSYIQAHDDETEAFRAYAKLYPGTVLLVDTYDALAGVDKVIHLVKEEGLDVSAIRLDSGDLGKLAKAARKQLDQAGLTGVGIVVSSGLDEWGIRELIEADAPVDSFAVGTKLGVSEDAPVLDLAYKLTDYEGKPRLKNSPGKKLLPGRKQVWRFRDKNAQYLYDEISLESETRDGKPLLFKAVCEGKPVAPKPDLNITTERVREACSAMPERLLALDACDFPYEVKISDALEQLYHKALADISANQASTDQSPD